MGNIAKFYPKMKISEQVKYANILVFKVTKTIFVKEFHSTYREFLPNANFITANFITAVFQNYY